MSGPAVMLAVMLAATLAWVPLPIVIRHDRADARHRALAERFPSVVHLNLLEDTPDGEGVLVHPEWVLTAAHVAVEVEAGHRFTVGGEEIAAAEVFLHPEWEDGGAADLALVRLSRAAEGVEPVPVYRERDEEGRLLYLVGYGDTGTGITGPTGNDGRLRAATNRVDEASPFWLKFAFDDPRTSAAATELEGISGPGDSGGPAYVIRNGVQYVVGVSSGQSTSATGGREGVYGVTEYYTRASSYVGWIDEVIGGVGAMSDRP